ncbi:DNA methyltransferase [Candidatus Dojkabacteria bacterium HGW-Dojkabacteria-1]|uniref:site-specific DNA-methyltransferase (adenine-specific) n=1 Tax=Candidatus Dojkabacteria bacterium HGW-Dojkabacteria-1 TaxID=2013761 RepID=A0A2N2F3A6_9BACT|nr:MAG: DNA methyltransferase [Candidatus Dojkabacteria bacterium HGW-Dojkabacteria-1]
MQQTFEKYLSSISEIYKSEKGTEYSYRTPIQNLLQEIFNRIEVRKIRQEAKTEDKNKPDFVIFNGEIPILYMETKDLGVSLDKIEKSEQMARYYGYANLVLTDYLEFRFYRNGLLYQEPIKIGNVDKKTKTISSIPDNYVLLEKTLVDFSKSYKEPIKSGAHLSKIMAGKAQRIRDNVKEFLKEGTEIARVYEMIKKLLVSDLTVESFADMYAQTLVYGLFAARYNDESQDRFTRQEARDLVPQSNPLLMHFFDHIAGPNFDKRLEYIVDELCQIFSHADVKNLLEEYFEKKDGKDPVIHFYEDFLQEYDPALRKRMGAYYTPLPVVNFIVTSVDTILKKDFNLHNGLADTSKSADGKHTVQVLDPATGTGTFISAVINLIYKNILDSGQKGRWPSYVHHDLLPRIHAFELMMAPYTIAHLKLSIAFKKTGFIHFNKRLGIYLTNALEQGIKQEGLFSFGFAESITEESKEAEKIKRNTSVMVVIGNPPYSGVSSNETPYAKSIINKYKVEPGGDEKLKEKKHWLNDDYVKFFGLAENFIEKNNSGIVAFITNHGYLENPTFRGMRWSLLKTFDKIYIIDLHGNTKTKDISPDGSKDENVFDIQPGVAIFIGIKTNKKKSNELGKIFRYDIWGTREKKLRELNSLKIGSTPFLQIKYQEPYYFFEEKNYENINEYNRGISLQEFFKVHSMGITTAKDNYAVNTNKNNLEKKIKDFYDPNLTDEEIKSKYSLQDNALWKLSDTRKGGKTYREDLIKTYSYRIFDNRFIYYHKNIVFNPRHAVMKHILEKPNFVLNSTKRDRSPFHCYFVTKDITDKAICSPLDNSYVFPLYLYSDDGTKTPNLNTEIVKKIEEIVGKTTPEDIFDYIYAVLHSPKYREKYKEFLKIDFPRVPYPKDKESFKKLVKIGTKLRELHLMESSKINKYITTYPISGSDVVEKIRYKNSNVYINDTQYFGNVSEIAWNFYIGGYQPAQKWLKDRRGIELTNIDIEHYQKIIVILEKTDRIMKEIDKNIKNETI